MACLGSNVDKYILIKYKRNLNKHLKKCKIRKEKEEEKRNNNNWNRF